MAINLCRLARELVNAQGTHLLVTLPIREEQEGKEE